MDSAQVQIELRPVLPDGLRAEVERARRLVADLDLAQRTAAEASRAAVRDLAAAGLTGADTARILGVSPQRVSQLAA